MKTMLLTAVLTFNIIHIAEAKPLTRKNISLTYEIPYNGLCTEGSLGFYRVDILLEGCYGLPIYGIHGIKAGTGFMVHAFEMPKSPWTAFFRIGMKFSMDMHFRRKLTDLGFIVECLAIDGGLQIASFSKNVRLFATAQFSFGIGFGLLPNSETIPIVAFQSGLRIIAF